MIRSSISDEEPRVYSVEDVTEAAVFGIEAHTVQVEVDVSFGLPHFTMVGLPNATVRESRDRVRSAIRNSGFEFPAHRITVNLAPGSLRDFEHGQPESARDRDNRCVCR